MMTASHRIILSPFQGFHYRLCHSIPLHGMFRYPALSGLIELIVCDKIEEIITQSLQQAETLRQSILKKAFEGKLVTMPAKEMDNLSKSESFHKETAPAPKGRNTRTMGAAHRKGKGNTPKPQRGEITLNKKITWDNHS